MKEIEEIYAEEAARVQREKGMQKKLSAFAKTMQTLQDRIDELREQTAKTNVPTVTNTTIHTNSDDSNDDDDSDDDDDDDNNNGSNSDTDNATNSNTNNKESSSANSASNESNARKPILIPKTKLKQISNNDSKNTHENYEKNYSGIPNKNNSKSESQHTDSKDSKGTMAQPSAYRRRRHRLLKKRQKNYEEEELDPINAWLEPWPEYELKKKISDVIFRRPGDRDGPIGDRGGPT